MLGEVAGLERARQRDVRKLFADCPSSVGGRLQSCRRECAEQWAGDAGYAHAEQRMRYAVTPDGRYFVVRGRLWRCTDPNLPDVQRSELTRELMKARRNKRQAMRAGDAEARERARQRVDAAKHALGERGPVWWTDGAPDYNRKMARNTPYAEWFASLAVPENEPTVFSSTDLGSGSPGCSGSAHKPHIFRRREQAV